MASQNLTDQCCPHCQQYEDQLVREREITRMVLKEIQPSLKSQGDLLKLLYGEGHVEAARTAGSVRCAPVAPQLTVISAPALKKAFTHRRGTPTRLGWEPTRRRLVR